MAIGKTIKLTFVIMSLGIIANAQIKLPKSITTDSLKNASVIYKYLNGKYDFVVGYTTESYWQSNRVNYVVVALKNGLWYKGALVLQKNKHDSWSKAQIKMALVNSLLAKTIANQLSTDLLQINTDSLNINKRTISPKSYQVFQVSDGVNYKFEIFNKVDFAIIEAYEPDYFFSKLPEIKSREAFIHIRDRFVSEYKTL